MLLRCASVLFKSVVSNQWSIERSIFILGAKMQDTRPPNHSQRRIEHLRLLNYSMDVDEDKVEAVVHTSGLHYTDFDSKNGMPKPWQLLKILEASRFFSHHWPLDDSGRTFRDYNKMTADCLTFLVTSSLDIDQSLYDFTIPKSPLNIKIQGGYIGNTSLNSIATIYTGTGQQLLSNVNHVVTINKTTRRPTPVPEWWKEKYSEHGKKHSALKFDKFAKPDGVKAFKINVVRSDLDGNNHVNWSCYLRFALDGMYHSVKHHEVTDFDDIEKRGLKRVELLYAGESFDDDVLDVFVWNHSSDKNKVCVHIEKASTLLFQCTLEYYEKQYL